jgi:hypothetical protein
VIKITRCNKSTEFAKSQTFSGRNSSGIILYAAGIPTSMNATNDASLIKPNALLSINDIIFLIFDMIPLNMLEQHIQLPNS